MALTKPKLSTNINTDSSVFTDPILVLHQGSSVADVDVGFLMNRSNGLTSNAAVIWQESSKSFVHILTDSSGAPDANLNVQSYANVSVGNVLLINNAGIYVDGTLGTAGQVLASDGSKTYWAPPGGFTGGVVSGATVFQSNLVVSNTTTSTNTTTGALVVLGGAGISGALHIQHTGDVSANIGTLFTGNNVTNANLGAFQTFSNANAATQAISITSITTNANANTAAYLLTATGNINAGNITTSGTSGNISGVNYIFAGNYAYANGVSILSGIGGTYSNTNVAAYLTLGANIGSGSTTGNLVAAATTISTSTTTGALVVRGGMGIAGNIYSGANVVITNGIFWAANGLSYSTAAGNNPFDSDSNLGLVTESVSSLFDLGFTTDASVTESYDLGGLISNSVIYGTSIIANTIAGTKLITGTDIVAGILTASSVTSAILVSTGSANIAGNITTANLLIANVTISANTVNPSAAQINGVDIATVNNINDINNVYDLDDISSYTNGIRQVFTLSYNLANVTLSSPWQLSVAVNGTPLPAFNSSPNAAIVWQSYVFPANKGYTLGSNSTIKFTEAPAARSDVYLRKQPGSTPSVIKIYPFKPIDIMIGY